MNEIKVFGHQSPDTDAIASAIVWAWFLKNYRKLDARPYVLGSTNKEALFVLEKWGHSLPPVLHSVSFSDTISIVDTNNLDELFENINEANIYSVIDHHKLNGGLKTSTPLEVVIQPYASTMTVMFNVMNIEPENFPREIAGLMLSGILSDTLEFRSPTTTAHDRELAEKLASCLDINISEYATEMFLAKSDITDFTDNELIKLDSKVFNIKGKQIRISVVETTNPDSVLARREGIVSAMETTVNEEGIEMVLMFVIDILKENALLFTHENDAKKIAKESFGIETTGNVTVLPGIVSRKKQIIPLLCK
ncbi:MAG: manganese-dependent inorganic pyrophosphatase [Candidatus Pacebacteria bacterium]|nr:manganese-dependent inorganic pyrophosphatase [Candidatus Paceibacterota bacterium]